MANVTVASNSDAHWGKWVPYYYQSFYLGSTGESNATDGNAYITQTTPSSGGSDVYVLGACTSSVNCGYYYELVFNQTGIDDTFYVKKYALNGTLVDTIYSITTTTVAKYWEYQAARAISIDVGVVIMLGSTTTFDDGDVYRVNLPSADTMIRRRIYHGGYSTFMRVPNCEPGNALHGNYSLVSAYHSDIIPCGLKNKNITFVMLEKVPGINVMPVQATGNTILDGVAPEVGNVAISAYLEWNVDSSAANSSTAGNDGATSPEHSFGTGETWALGTVFADSVDWNGTVDIPVISNSSYTDVSGGTDTGSPQTLNVSRSGRSGHAKLKFSFDDGAGASKVLARNQYIRCVLMISS